MNGHSNGHNARQSSKLIVGTANFFSWQKQAKRDCGKWRVVKFSKRQPPLYTVEVNTVGAGLKESQLGPYRVRANTLGVTLKRDVLKTALTSLGNVHRWRLIEPKYHVWSHVPLPQDPGFANFWKFVRMSVLRRSVLTKRLGESRRPMNFVLIHRIRRLDHLIQTWPMEGSRLCIRGRSSHTCWNSHCRECL